MATITEVAATAHVPSFTQSDYTKMRGIAKAVYDNPSLLEEFERDPEQTTRDQARQHQTASTSQDSSLKTRW